MTISARFFCAFIGAVVGGAVVVALELAFFLALIWMLGVSPRRVLLGWFLMPIVGVVGGALLGYSADTVYGNVRRAIDEAPSNIRLWFAFGALWMIVVVIVFSVFTPFGRYWYGHEWSKFLTILLGPVVVGLLCLQLFSWATRNRHPQHAERTVLTGADDWKQVQSSTDPGRLRSFARQFPGYYGELARARATELEQAAAAAAEMAASVRAFERFLADFPESPHAGVVRQYLPALREHEQQAAAAWADAQRLTDPARLQQFAQHFPGKYAALARKRIEALKQGPNPKPGSGKTEWFTDIDIGPEMVVVPGSPAFAIGRFAVTFAEWDAAQAHPEWRKHAKIEPRKANDYGWGRGKQPVIDVSWNDAKAYCTWLSVVTGKTYRLPSETEWEQACRAGSKTEFWWGNEISTAQANYNGDYTFGNGKKGEYRQRTVPVDSFAPNPWGLYQVHGNVWEWCEDAFDSYSRVVRGGSWVSNPYLLRSSDRSGDAAVIRVNVLGFRVARVLPPAGTLFSLSTLIES